jgi:hypothetical protein
MIEIGNASTLSDLFGHWPNFHDAELITLRLDATDHSDSQLEAEFEVAEMSDEVDDRGYYKDRQRARTTLRFNRVARLLVSDFHSQNVLRSLEFSETAPEDYDRTLGPRQGHRRYCVQWESAVGCEADFLCDSIEVLAASPFARSI